MCSGHVETPDDLLPLRLLALTVLGIADIVLFNPAIIASSRRVIRVRTICARSFIALFMVFGVDSEVSEMDVCAFWIDVRSSCWVCLIYCTFPTEFNKAFIAASVPIKQIPIIAEILGCCSCSCVVSAVSASTWNIVIAGIPCLSLTSHCTSRQIVNVVRPNRVSCWRIVVIVMLTLFKRP